MAAPNYVSLDKMIVELVNLKAIVPFKQRDWRDRFLNAGVTCSEEVPTMTKEQWTRLGQLSENVKGGLKSIFPGLEIPRSAQEEREYQQRLIQEKCPHDNLVESSIDPSACLTVYQTTCTACNQVLICSYSTSYDRDPPTKVASWDWYLSYYKKKYPGSNPPRPADYVVEYLTPEF